MTDESLIRRLVYEYPYYGDFVEPKGALSIDKRSHACFHYTKLAMRARYLAGKGPESQVIQYKVGDTPPEWMESRDLDIARGVALLYGLENPGDFLANEWCKRAWTQATQFLGLSVDLSIYEVSPGGDRNKIQ